MVNEKLRKYLSEKYSEDIIILDNPSYDKSIIGVTKNSEGKYVVIMYYDKMVEEYMADNSCSYEDAVEWIDYNTLGALPGIPNHPIIVNDFDKILVTIPKEYENIVDKYFSDSYEIKEGEFGEDDKISFSAEFRDGNNMYIDMCGVQYEEGHDNKPYAQATLNDEKGRELAFTEPAEQLLGDWCIEYNDFEYKVVVIKESDLILEDVR